MVGSVTQIEQDLAALDAAIAAIAEELHDAYSSYLTALGQAVSQQIILACYHVCTQGYPDGFLRLPVSQRQQLQQTLRHLAQQVQEELLAQLHVPIVPVNLLDEPETDEESPEPAATPETLTPTHLAQWQHDLEQAIVDELRTASHAANRLLQQADVLPKKLPEPVLEAAAKADAAEGAGSTPNLLTMLVETVDDADKDKSKSDSKGPAVMHIVAIYLRLAEIEFADTLVTAARTQIRSLTARLKTLGREYQKKQRDRAVAEAQAAWRSTWTDE